MNQAVRRSFQALISAAVCLVELPRSVWRRSSHDLGNLRCMRSRNGSANLIMYGVVKVVMTDTAMMTG